MCSERIRTAFSGEATANGGLLWQDRRLRLRSARNGPSREASDLV